jgi:hypothetical protein
MPVESLRNVIGDPCVVLGGIAIAADDVDDVLVDAIHASIRSIPGADQITA